MDRFPDLYGNANVYNNAFNNRNRHGNIYADSVADFNGNAHYYRNIIHDKYIYLHAHRYANIYIYRYAFGYRNQDGKRDCDADSFFNRYNHGDSKLYGRKGRGLLCIPPAVVKFANFRIFIGFRG